MDQAQIIGIAIGLGGLALLGLIGFIKSNMVICQPNEIVILSGRKRRQPDGTTVGYRIIRGGRGFKWLGPKVATVREKTTWECPQGHRWQARYTDVRRGSGCPGCRERAAKTPADYRALAKERGFRWLCHVGSCADVGGLDGREVWSICKFTL